MYMLHVRLSCSCLPPPSAGATGAASWSTWWSMRSFVFFAALLHFSGSASAFCPRIRATVPHRVVLALRAHNEFDVWWAERRVRNRVGAPGSQTQVLDALPLDVPSLTLVLEEFVESNYASQVCSCCNLQPTDYGCIGGM